MRSITDYSDSRNKAWCIHCTRALSNMPVTRDHVPTKGLLREPLPDNVPVIPVCLECNNGFSADEEYLIAFLGCVLSGSTDPKDHQEGSARILSRQGKLRELIERSKRTFTTAGGETKIVWQPDHKRIERVVVKNARGHIFFELGEPMLEAPASVWATPLETMKADDRNEFERRNSRSWGAGAIWPEVGSRMMQRCVTGADTDGEWVIVQPGVYRYAVDEGPIGIRLVIAEYLAAEVSWAI